MHISHGESFIRVFLGNKHSVKSKMSHLVSYDCLSPSRNLKWHFGQVRSAPDFTCTYTSCSVKRLASFSLGCLTTAWWPSTWTQTAVRQVENGHTFTYSFNACDHTRMHICQPFMGLLSQRIDNIIKERWSVPAIWPHHTYKQLLLVQNKTLIDFIATLQYPGLTFSTSYCPSSTWGCQNGWAGTFILEKDKPGALGSVPSVLLYHEEMPTEPQLWIHLEAWRITWHCCYCALWVHLARNPNINKPLRKIKAKAKRTP